MKRTAISIICAINLINVNIEIRVYIEYTIERHNYCLKGVYIQFSITMTSEATINVINTSPQTNDASEEVSAVTDVITPTYDVSVSRTDVTTYDFTTFEDVTTNNMTSYEDLISTTQESGYSSKNMDTTEIVLIATLVAVGTIFLFVVVSVLKSSVLISKLYSISI